MIVVFDLDYTTLDSIKFKNDLGKTIGLSHKEFKVSYNKYFRDKINYPSLYRHYSPSKHLQILKKDNIIDSVKNCQKKVDLYLKKIDNYLFPEAENIIKRFKNKGNKLILISFGNKSWQKNKIDNLKIKKLFNKIVIVDKSKHEALNFLKKSKEEILIINDNAYEIIEMQKAIGKCEVCLIRGPYSKNVEHNLKVYNIKDCLKMYE